MDDLLLRRILVALVAFLAVALAVVAVALLAEGLRSLIRGRAVSQELRRLSHRTGFTPLPGGASDLLREERGALPAWIVPLARRIPRLSDIGDLLEQSRSTWTVSTFLTLTIAFGVVAGTVMALLQMGFLITLVSAAMAAGIPYVILVRRRAKRLRDFEEGFAEAIDLMARSARAGHAFQTGLREVADESPNPIGEEFRQVFEEQKFGLPLAESLLGLADRIDLVDVRLFVTSVLIQKETGGNLAENMDNLAHIIRERFRFKRQINVHTAHGRMTGAVLAIMPIAMALLLLVISPGYMTFMFTESLGRWMLAAAGGLQIFGYLVIRRLTDLDY